MFRLTKIKNKNNPHDKSDVFIEIEEDDIALDEFLSVIDDYLRACGFRYTGELTIIEEE